MIIPPALATAQPSSPLGDNDNADEKPSLSNLLMAAAEMHKLGRLSGKAPKVKAMKDPLAP